MEEQTLVSGVTDVIRLDDPPRVTLIDFKSGDSEDETSSGLDEADMELQVSLYGLAAKKELEYDPDRGVIRYLGETIPQQREHSVILDSESLAAARATVLDTVNIRRRIFRSGPPQESVSKGCPKCDFRGMCALHSRVNTDA